MVTAMVDTSVLIDVLHKQPLAEGWLRQQVQPGQLGVSSVVWLEVIQGAQNNRHMREALTLLGSMERIEATPVDHS